MPARPDFSEALLTRMSLAKVGNAHRKEPFQTSKALCRFEDSEAELLTHCFLKPFRSLEPYRFVHAGGDLTKNEVFSYARAVFADPGTLLENGARIAAHLYATSHHPNIKAGDLCVALIDDVTIDGKATRALGIIKSESKVPFLQISVDGGGDLRLTTQQGIYPDKIDKGCLVIDSAENDGFVAFVFDKSGASTHFWVRDFLGVEPLKTDDFLTRRYTELCVAFAEKGLPEETVRDERNALAEKAVAHLARADEFDLRTFETDVLAEPDRIERFSAFKSDYETGAGTTLDDRFPVAKKIAEKAQAKLRRRMVLDCGAELRFSPSFVQQSDHFLERGFDKQRHMHFVKIYYNQEA